MMKECPYVKTSIKVSGVNQNKTRPNFKWGGNPGVWVNLLEDLAPEKHKSGEKDTGKDSLKNKW